MQANELVPKDDIAAKKFALNVADSDINALSASMQKGDIAGIWENCEDYERLSQATISTMKHLNDEHMRIMLEQLNSNNEAMLKATFDGVKRHHEKKLNKIIRKYKNRAGIAAALAFIAGVAVGWLVFGLPHA